MDVAAWIGPMKVVLQELVSSRLLLGDPGDNGIEAAHVWAQGLGDEDGAVGLLVVFENGEPGAAHGEAAAVDGVDEFIFAFGGGLETNVGAAGLEGFEVRTGGDFAVKLLGRGAGLRRSKVLA